MNFRRSVIIAELWRPEVARPLKNLRFLHVFGKTTPFSESFHSDTDRRVVCKFREMWPTGNRSNRA